MKRALKNFGHFFIISLLVFSVTGIKAHDMKTDSPTHLETVTTVLGDNLVGGWSYTVEGAPEGYEKGFLVIMKENDQYKVQVQVGTSTLLGENVKVKGKEISFNVLIEGDKVSVTLTAKGSAISGTSTSSEATYKINGTKSISAG